MNIIKRAKRTLGTLLLATSMFLPIGCGDSGGDSPDPNNAPNITTSIGATSGTVGVGYNHDVDATDPESDPITYSLPTAPTGMTINSSTGLMNWTPAVGDSGINHPVTVRASDGSKNTDQSWGIFISETGDPTFNSIAKTDGIEGILYQYVVTATDPESDPLTFTLQTNPSEMTITPINSTSARINWTPSIVQERQNHEVVVSADDDFGGHAEQSFQVWPRGRENISGNVKELGTGTNIQDITVTVTEATTGAYQTNTDGSGNWTLTNIPDGDNETMFTDGSDQYETFKPGKLRVSATSHKSGLQTRLALKVDEAFMRNAGRMDPLSPQDDDKLKRWDVRPIWDVYTKEYLSGTTVNGALVTGVKDVIKNELSQYTQNHFGAFTDDDINVINEVHPVSQPADGHIWIGWNNSVSAGTNYSWFDGDRILSGRSVLNTSMGKDVMLQELTENLIGSGETKDANYSDSALYDWSANTSYSNDDLKLSDFHYGTYTLGSDTLYFRATGNEDKGTADNHDVNPDGTIWNEEE